MELRRWGPAAEAEGGCAVRASLFPVKMVQAPWGRGGGPCVLSNILNLHLEWRGYSHTQLEYILFLT